MSGRITVTARTWEAGAPRVFEATGQTARALLALVDAGARGVTALECSTWAYRLAAYCYDLRRDHGLAIRCDREEHPGGWHGRHVLESAVEIVAVETTEETAA
jgi:hypothetical protein